MPVEIRRTLLWQQTTYLEGWEKVPEPTLLVAALVIIKNPWFGRGYVENMRPEIQEHGPVIGKLLTKMLLDICGDKLEGCGQGTNSCNFNDSGSLCNFDDCRQHSF